MFLCFFVLFFVLGWVFFSFVLLGIMHFFVYLHQNVPGVGLFGANWCTVPAFGTVLCEVQFEHERWRPLMKCTAFYIAENLSESIFYMHKDIHSFTSLMKINKI